MILYLIVSADLLLCVAFVYGCFVFKGFSKVEFVGLLNRWFCGGKSAIRLVVKYIENK